jgi:pimeloyl-ACP methyl ester carboxylesterase
MTNPSAVHRTSTAPVPRTSTGSRASRAAGPEPDTSRGTGAGHPVVFLPGGILPAELAYGALRAALGDAVEAVLLDLAVYATGTIPHGYGIGTEVSAVLRAADAAGLDTFHLVGYSGGGAVALALAAEHPGRLRSLALIEPAWVGTSGRSLAEEEIWGRLDLGGDDTELMSGFVALQLRPGVVPPPPPPGPPPWMARRPAGIRALVSAFRAADLDHDRLRSFTRPVHHALGGLSNPDYFGRQADRLAGLFADFTAETYPDLHHLTPPHRAEPERYAATLRALWSRAEATAALVS